MSKPLADRIALVTGASRGIGRATALALAREGAHVVAVARTVGGLEEVDDAARAAGSSATLVPLDMRDYAGLYRLAAALNERYQHLDMLIGNAAIAGQRSPLDHIEPQAWDEVIRDQCDRELASHPRHGSAAQARQSRPRRVHDVRRRDQCPRLCRSLFGHRRQRSTRWRGPMRRKRASTPMRVNLFNPGPTRTRMRAQVMPGEDPMTLPTPEDVAEKIVDLCLPEFSETGKLYDFPAGKLLEFMPPPRA